LPVKALEDFEVPAALAELSGTLDFVSMRH